MDIGIGIDFGSHAGEGAAVDTTPTAFSFTDQTDVPVSSVRTSNSITVEGTNESTTVSITGGTYSRNGGAYTATAGRAYPGDSFTVRHTSSGSGQTATNTVLTIGGVSDTFTSTTADVTAPTITSADSGNCEENATLAFALTANESVTWTITGGADAARFEIDGSALRWAGDGTKDFETPDDADTNNAYIVQVTATDAALNATNQTITITVTDVVEGPVELLIDTDMPGTANWLPGHTGGTVDPQIIGGEGVFTAETEGNTQHLTQTLAGGSLPAGDYVVGVDVSANSDWLQLRLLGAANEIRGSASFEGTGAGLTDTITATGEVSKFRINTASDVTMSNPTMQAA